MILLENDAFPFRANRHELSHLDPFQDHAVAWGFKSLTVSCFHLRTVCVCGGKGRVCSPAVEMERKSEGHKLNLYL